LEVANAVDYLKGKSEPRLQEVVLALGEELLVMAGLAETQSRARQMLEKVIADGHAAEHFQHMVKALGGPADFLERPHAYLPQAPLIRPVVPASPGRVTAIDARLLGLAVIALGGGRSHPEARIDHAVGLTALARRNAEVGEDMPLAMIHARDAASAAVAQQLIRSAYRLGEAVSAPPLIRGRIN
jgi:thymidine phosphorylase